MRRTVAIVSNVLVLVFAFAFIVTAQETSSPDDTISNLKQQLMEIEWNETELRIRHEELDEELKPANIEIAVAGIGSTHPEDLREHRRKLLTIERDGIQTQLDLLEEKRARIKAAIAAAEFAAYLKYALPSPTPSPATSPSKPITQGMISPEEARPRTGTLRSVITTKGLDAQSYAIPDANLKLNGAVQLIGASSNDQGEYEFTNVPVGTYTLVASAQGFETTVKIVTVGAGATLIENISLEVAEIKELVTVKSTAEGIQLTKTSPATTIQERATNQSAIILNGATVTDPASGWPAKSIREARS